MEKKNYFNYDSAWSEPYDEQILCANDDKRHVSHLSNGQV